MIVNPIDYNEQFYKHNYLITLTAQGFEFTANADCAGDAMDEVIDYCEDNYPGLLMNREEEDNEEYLEDYVIGGNHGRYLNTMHVKIDKIKEQ